MQINEARPLQRLERGDRGHDLHTIVCGMRLSSLQFAGMVAELFPEQAPSV
jgi:hypothetical protein